MTQDVLLEQHLADETMTVRFGEALGRALQLQLQDASAALVVHLDGDLGAGKTTSTRGVLRGFGHSGAVKSPTYTLVEPYELDRGRVFHFDLYRLGDPEELEYMGIRDYFSAGTVCLIEWPGRGAGVLPAPDLRVTLSVQGQGRCVKVEAESAPGLATLDALMKTLPIPQ